MGRIEHTKEVQPHHSLHFFTNKETGKIDGSFFVTDKSTAKVIAVYNYCNGRKHGKFKKWNKDGNISIKGAYFFGCLDGEIIYYEDNAPSFSLVYVLGTFITIKSIGKQSERYKQLKTILKDRKRWIKWE